MGGGKISLRDSEEQFERQGGVSELLAKYDLDIPPAAEHVWGWFQDLAAGRTCGQIMNPLTWADIDAWARLVGITPAVWELSAIKALDATFLSFHTDK